MIAGVLEIQLMANMSRLSDDMRRTERVVGDSMTKVERSVASASRALSSLGLGVSIGLIADQMRRTADSFTKLDAQIRLSTKSQQQYNQALGDIRRISTIAQSDIAATTMLYTRLLNTTDGMGISQGKLATVTETVSYGLKAYGATSAEAASAALQLSQAMGANRLGGEEFRAVMEAMPNVMKVLAKSMGVPLGELRALSIAGKITTAEMVKAFGDPAVAAEFKKMAERAQTITGAWTVARNELTLLFGEFAKSSGLTQGMISAFNGLAGALRTVAQYIGEITMLLGAWVALRVTQMIYGYVAALIAQRAAALAAAQAELARVNMTYGASAATVAAARSSYAYAAANTTLGGSLMILGQRMAAFAAANAAAIALTTLAVAAVALKRDFDAAIDSVSRFQAKIRGMDVEALRAARQLEVANVAAMKASIFSGFNERDILFAERRIRMMDAQIIAAEKLAKAEEEVAAARGLGGGGKAAKPALDRTTILERMGNEMKAMNEAELSGKLNNVEKVGVAWANLNDQQKKDAKYLADYEYALNQARIADWRKIRDQIADSITRGIMEGAKAEDVLKDMFKQMVLEPTVKLAVTAGVDWVASMLGNTTATTTLASSQAALIAALNANTAAQGGSTTGSAASGAGMSSGTLGYAALFAAVAYYGFGLNNREMQAQPVRTRGVATRAGFEGEQTQDFTRQGGWFTSGDSYTLRYAISTAQHRAYKDAIDALQATYSSLAIQIGLTSIATQEWSVEINTTGDVTKLLADGIGNQLLPALELFRKEGETLADTAKRLTSVFQSTNDFISALGVTSAQAFGSYGILSADQRQALIAAAGGEQAFSQFAGSFMTNILTPAERLKASLAAVGKVFATLGVTGINTKEQFADLVKEMLQKGDYSAVGALLSVSDAFAKITDSASEANAQLEKLLNKNTFETLVSYTRAAKTSQGSPTGQSISKAIEDATVTVGEEEKAARIANKQAALEKLNKLLADFNDLLNGLAVARNLHGWSDSLYSQVLGAAHNQWDPMISAARAYYDSLPAFATGGDHMGGLRLVGENGPELEATGPSRIYTASQTASMLSDGVGGATVADEVRMLRREAAAHAIALNTATQKLAKIADRWDLQGLPPERIAA